MTKFIKRVNEKYFDLASISIFAICCFVSLFWQWFSLSVVSFAIFYFIVSNHEKSLCAAAFLIPFHNVLRVADLTIITYCVYIACFVIIFFKQMKAKEIHFNKILVFMLSALLLYSLLPLGSYKMIRWRWISTFFIIISVCFVLKHLMKKVEFSKVVYALFIGIVFSSILRICFESGEFIEKFQLNYNPERFEALMINPNYLSEACAMLSAMLLVVLYKNKNLIFTSIAIVITIFIGLQTGSKSFAILSILFIFMFVLFYFLKAIKTHNLVLQISLIGALILGLIVSVIFIRERINFNSNITTTSLLTSRDIIWEIAFKELSKNPITLLFGLGVGSEIRWENAQTCHSVYIEILQKFGIVGSLIFISLTIYSIVLLFKYFNLKKNLINLLPVAILAIYSLTDTIIFPATSMMIFPLCLVCLFYSLQEKEKYIK